MVIKNSHSNFFAQLFPGLPAHPFAGTEHIESMNVPMVNIYGCFHTRLLQIPDIRERLLIKWLPVT